MPSSTLDALPPLDPPERHGQIEVDVFCTSCFYNLHGQIVTIDPRLNFPVCRCPECGRFHPAGTGVTSSNVWMRRIASILLFVWVAIVGAMTLAISFAFFGLSAVSVEAFTYYGESIPNGVNHYVQHLHPWEYTGNYNSIVDNNANGIATMMWISAGSLVLGFITGLLCVTLLWHWKRPRYLWAMIVPFTPAAGLAMIYHAAPNYDGIRMDCMEHVLSQTGIQCTGIFLGVLLGRKVSRAIVKMIIPPKPRQALVFLWMVDGKKPPQA